MNEGVDSIYVYTYVYVCTYIYIYRYIYWFTSDHQVCGSKPRDPMMGSKPSAAWTMLVRPKGVPLVAMSGKWKFSIAVFVRCHLCDSVWSFNSWLCWKCIVTHTLTCFWKKMKHKCCLITGGGTFCATWMIFPVTDESKDDEQSPFDIRPSFHQLVLVSCLRAVRTAPRVGASGGMEEHLETS